MDQYRQMLRQALSSSLSANKIGAQRGISHHTVRRWRLLAKEACLTVEKLDQMTDADLRAMFKPNAKQSEHLIEPDWQEELAFMKKGFTRLDAHQKYVDRVGEANALKYRSYCERFSKFEKTLHPILRLQYAPGFEMQTDFAGYKVPGRNNSSSEIVYFKLFVAVLPFSRLGFLFITRSENTDDHIEANIKALEYFGGAPIITRPDNLKAAVISRPKYKAPRLNQKYQEFLDHYGLGCDPARPGQATDKSQAESLVKISQRLLRLRLHDSPPKTITELRKIASELNEQINNRPLRRAAGHSRRTLFDAEEKSHLRTLPDSPFEISDTTVNRLVHRDYHVEYKGNFYSVPYKHIGQKASVRPRQASIEIYINGKVAAIHSRSYECNKYITISSHRPENHSAMVEVDLHDWASKFSPACVELVEYEASADYPKRKRLAREKWIQSLPRQHGRARFLNACERAVRLNDYRFEHVENALRRGIEGSLSDYSDVEPLNPRRNVRGGGYYQKKDPRNEA